MPSSVYQRSRSSIQVRYQRSASVGRDEELHLHLLELAGAEDEVARGDLVAEGLADLGDPERGLAPRELEDVLEVDEDALRGLRPQVDLGALARHRPDVGLEHQVELARLGEVAVGPLARLLRRLFPALAVLELVGAEAQLAGAAVDQRVGEAGQVPRRLPDPRVLEDRRVERDDVVALVDHRPPPLGLDVVLQQDAVVAVVVGRAEPAVDLRGGEDEAAPLAERDDLLHRDFLRACLLRGGHCGNGIAAGARAGARRGFPTPAAIIAPPCRSMSTSATTGTSST